MSPITRHQRCTVHKTANVLDKMPNSVQPAAKADLREIWAAPDRANSGAAVATFAEKYREPPPNWWTPLLSSERSGKVSNGPGTSSVYG